MNGMDFKCCLSPGWRAVEAEFGTARRFVLMAYMCTRVCGCDAREEADRVSTELGAETVEMEIKRRMFDSSMVQNKNPGESISLSSCLLSVSFPRFCQPCVSCIGDVSSEMFGIQTCKWRLCLFSEGIPAPRDVRLISLGFLL